jgi:hypothetical protein
VLPITKLSHRLIFSVIGVLIFSLLSQLAYAHGMSEAEKQSIIDGGNLSYMWLGATHMLSGYDHLAFVFGIIFFLSSFRDIVKYITAFTLGHSVTLIFATFNGIQLNYFLVDAVIALSVCYIAFSNIDGFRKYLNIKAPNMLFMITGLGLIHGFGLSTRLQQLPLSEDNLLLNIISFNVGIELGQISALAVMLLLIAAWRKRRSFQTFSLVANYSLILMGVYLFMMQMHGYSHTSHPDEFIASTPSAAPMTNVPITDAPMINTAMASTEVVSSKTLTQATRQDSISILIPARGDKEYKLHLAKGATLEYTWKTEGAELFYDFHGEPAGDTSGYFKSFKKSTDSEASGSLTTVFDGTHGWYWKNNTSSAVTIALKTKGEYQRLDLTGKLEQETGNIKPVKQTNVTTHDTIDTL